MTSQEVLTPMGEMLAELPVDVVIGKMASIFQVGKDSIWKIGLFMFRRVYMRVQMGQK